MSSIHRSCVPGKHRGASARAPESYAASGAEASRRISMPRMDQLDVLTDLPNLTTWPVGRVANKLAVIYSDVMSTLEYRHDTKWGENLSDDGKNEWRYRVGCGILQCRPDTSAHGLPYLRTHLFTRPSWQMSSECAGLASARSECPISTTSVFAY